MTLSELDFFIIKNAHSELQRTTPTLKDKWHGIRVFLVPQWPLFSYRMPKLSIQYFHCFSGENHLRTIGQSPWLQISTKVI